MRQQCGSCILDQYVLTAPTEEYIDWAREALSIPNRREIAEISYERFRAEMPLSNWLRPMLEHSAGVAVAPVPAATAPRH